MFFYNALDKIIYFMYTIYMECTHKSTKIAILLFIIISITTHSVHGDAKKILKEGLIGAGSGAIASSASGGDATKGALIGAGANIAGNAIFDAITSPNPKPKNEVRTVYIENDREYKRRPMHISRKWKKKLKRAKELAFNQGYKLGHEEGYIEGYINAYKEMQKFCNEKTE
jgi:hypothetical protein